jgi:arylsulfatase
MKLHRNFAAILLFVSACDAGADEIIHDAEHELTKAQHADAWAAEDTSINDALSALQKKHGKRPNIIHIMWDDTSLGEVGIPELNKVLGFDTPHINAMSDEGMAFTRMYTEPSCTPTRAAALTGRLSVRAGMHKVGFPPEGSGLHKDEVTIAEVLSANGYTTGFVGKGHQGDIEQAYLQNQGFDYANFSIYNQYPFMTWNPRAAVGGQVNGLFPFQWDKTHTLDKGFRPLGYINQLEATKGGKAKEFMGPPSPEGYKKLMRANQKQTVDFVKQHATDDAPFYLAYWPHMADPFVPPDQLTSNASTWWAYSMEQMDRDIGEILATLREQGVADNTLVIAMADNGPMHELAPNGPHEVIFAGYKSDHREGGVRVPAFAWWPDVIKAGQVVNDMITVHDLFTTFARLGGAMDAVPTDRVIDGVDQTALLLNGEGKSRRDYYHIYTGDVLAASMKQQIKRDWTDDRPGLVGDSFFDLYRDTREEHGDMPPYMWAWLAFDHMRERHVLQMEKYPNREVTRGPPYEGVEDLRPDAKALSDRLVKYNLSKH